MAIIVVGVVGVRRGYREMSTSIAVKHYDGAGVSGNIA